AGADGVGVVATVVAPGNPTLARDTDTTIKSSSDLAFDVTVENSGESPETSVVVTLAIQGTKAHPTPISKAETIDLINPSEQKVVEFKDLGQPPFVEPTTVKVDVKPVAGETNKSNKQAQYPVIFSL